MSTASRTDRRSLVTVLAGAFLVTHLGFALLPAASTWNLQATDTLFRLRERTGWGRPEVDPTLAFVGIDDSTESALDTREVERTHFAAVISTLNEIGVALQAHDSIWRRAGNDHEDAELVAAIGTGQVLAGFIGRLDEPPRTGLRVAPQPWPVVVVGDASAFPKASSPVWNFPELGDSLAGQGFLDVQADGDGVHRRAPLLARSGTGGFYPSLPLLAACRTLDVAPEQITVRPGRDITLAAASGAVVIPVDHQGRLRVNHVPWSSWRHFAFHEVHAAGRFEGGPGFGQLRDAVVIVADGSTAAGDVGPSPLHPSAPLPGLHGAVLNSILTGQFLAELGWFGMLPIELALLGLVFLLARRLPTPAFLGGGLGLGLLYLAAAVTSFCFGGVLLHLARPMTLLALALAGTTASRYLTEERTRAAVQGSFEAYFPAGVVRRLVANPEQVQLGGERKELTVLFSDIQGFTAASSQMEPDDVQALLNRYFGVMVDVVFRHGGTLDKFIGDGLMVFFGDPEPQEDHALRAVRTAVEMQRRLADLNQQWEAEGLQPIHIRIGVNTGPMLVGNMGSPRRLSYTVLGAEVNLAARLEPRAPVGGVLISQSTYDAVQGEVNARPVEPITAKGFDDPVPVYEVEV